MSKNKAVPKGRESLPMWVRLLDLPKLETTYRIAYKRYFKDQEGFGLKEGRYLFFTKEEMLAIAAKTEEFTAGRPWHKDGCVCQVCSVEKAEKTK